MEIIPIYDHVPSHLVRLRGEGGDDSNCGEDVLYGDADRGGDPGTAGYAAVDGNQADERLGGYGVDTLDVGSDDDIGDAAGGWEGCDPVFNDDAADIYEAPPP